MKEKFKIILEYDKLHRLSVLSSYSPSDGTLVVVTMDAYDKDGENIGTDKTLYPVERIFNCRDEVSGCYITVGSYFDHEDFGHIEYFPISYPIGFYNGSRFYYVINYKKYLEACSYLGVSPIDLKEYISRVEFQEDVGISIFKPKNLCL